LVAYFYYYIRFNCTSYGVNVLKGFGSAFPQNQTFGAQVAGSGIVSAFAGAMCFANPPAHTP
jgi:hypothetical protein